MKSGAWYSYNKERLGQGRENAKQFLKENPQVAQEIHDAIRAHYGLTDSPEDDDETDDQGEKQETLDDLK